MSNAIDLKKIFSYTWGFIGLPFPEMVIKGLPVVKRERSFIAADDMTFDVWLKNEISEKGVSIRHKNSKGVEIFMPIWLSSNDSDALEYLLPNTVMSISSKANIVTTALVNRDGTFKEEISLDDWEISIRGVMVGEGNNYPEQAVQTLTNWYATRAAFNIQNARTAICLSGGEKIVITDLRFPEIRGFENTQPYELKLISDKEFSLYIQ